jgi:hypothetical protein
MTRDTGSLETSPADKPKHIPRAPGGVAHPSLSPHPHPIPTPPTHPATGAVREALVWGALVRAMVTAHHAHAEKLSRVKPAQGSRQNGSEQQAPLHQLWPTRRCRRLRRWR